MRRDSGFTLIEVLMVILISATLMTLSATAVRHFWFLNAVESAAEMTESELRNVQQRTVAASHPMVYGVWFKEDVASSQWGTVRYNPMDASTGDDDVCTQVGSAQSFGDGVVVSDASFEPAGGTIESKCVAVAPSGSDLVFFYARGSATAGSVTLYEEKLDEERTVTVSGVTGRVERQ